MMTQQHDAPEGGVFAVPHRRESVHLAAGYKLYRHPDQPRYRLELVDEHNLWRGTITVGCVEEADRLLAALGRPSDRPKDAAGIVGEAIAVARAAQGPHTIPPAPSGLVDAVRVALPIGLARDALQFVIDGRCDDDDAGTEALRDDVIQALAATLSGQQGGAGLRPAGDLPSVEAFAEALYDLNLMPYHLKWGEVVKNSNSSEGKAIAEYRDSAKRLRARLAEQPAPAERSKEWWLDRARREDGCESVQAGDPAEQPAPAGTPIDPEMPLPCDVRVAPATIIRKGVRLQTLLLALYQRIGRPEQDTRFPEPAPIETGANGGWKPESTAPAGKLLITYRLGEEDVTRAGLRI
jgi:hypothetical protein